MNGFQVWLRCGSPQPSGLPDSLPLWLKTAGPLGVLGGGLGAEGSFHVGVAVQTIKVEVLG